MKKQICLVAAMSILAGCAVGPGSNPINQKGGASAQVSPIPPGYLDVLRFPQQQLAMHAASLWVKQAQTEDERFSRGMRVFADLRQDYYERLNAGLSASDTKKLLGAKVSERVSREYLPAGTIGLAFMVAGDTYPVDIASYQDSSGKLARLVGSGSYVLKIPGADAVLNASTSQKKPFHQNLLSILNDEKFEGKRVYPSINIDMPRVWINYPIPKEQFATSLYENRKKGLGLALKTSGYILFQLSNCDQDKNSDQLSCKSQLVSNNVENPTLVTERIGR